jgi:hypothetical protein
VISFFLMGGARLRCVPFRLKIGAVEFPHRFNCALWLQGRFDRRDVSISSFPRGFGPNSPGDVSEEAAD